VRKCTLFILLAKATLIYLVPTILQTFLKLLELQILFSSLDFRANLLFAQSFDHLTLRGTFHLSYRMDKIIQNSF